MFLRADFKDLGGYDHLHDIAALESAVAAAPETDAWRIRKRAAAARIVDRRRRSAISAGTTLSGRPL